MEPPPFLCSVCNASNEAAAIKQAPVSAPLAPGGRAPLAAPLANRDAQPATELQHSSKRPAGEPEQGRDQTRRGPGQQAADSIQADDAGFCCACRTAVCSIHGSGHGGTCREALSCRHEFSRGVLHHASHAAGHDQSLPAPILGSICGEGFAGHLHALQRDRQYRAVQCSTTGKRHVLLRMASAWLPAISLTTQLPGNRL